MHLSFCLFHSLLHHFNIFLGNVAIFIELESVFHLLTELLAKYVCGGLGEAVNARRNGALVGEVAGNTALVFGASAADKGRVEK